MSSRSPILVIWILCTNIVERGPKAPAPSRAAEPGSCPPFPCPRRQTTTRSSAPASSWPTYRTAGTSAPETTASAAAGRASPTRTRPGRPKAARPAPGDCSLGRRKRRVRPDRKPGPRLPLRSSCPPGLRRAEPKRTAGRNSTRASRPRTAAPGPRRTSP